MSRRLRIAWGVMGYGRGHATRVRSVLAEVQARHDVTIFAGGDAVPVLSPLAPVVKIPTLGYAYGHGGQLSIAATVARNAAGAADVLMGGAGLQRVMREIRRLQIDVVISDSEAWTHRAAARLGIPRISFDHVGVIAWCEPHAPADLWLPARRDGWGYRALMGAPDRILITSFYPARGLTPAVRTIGPVLRRELMDVAPTPGDYLLAYFNKGRHQYTPALDLALRRADARVIVYGTPYRGRIDNLEFRAPDNAGFIRDLAACRAVLSTAGNQLIGEALHFGKPFFALPENAFEQRLNGYMVERLGIGRRGRLDSLTAGDIEDFLTGADSYRPLLPRGWSAGRERAVDLLLGDLADLGGRARTPARAARGFTKPQSWPARLGPL